MSSRSLKSENRLKQFMDAGAGVGFTIDDAVKRAEVRVEQLREPMMIALGERVQKLHRIGREMEEGKTHPRVELYGLGNEIIGLAGSYGFKSLCEVIDSFCEFVDLQSDDMIGASTTMRLHLNALRVVWDERDVSSPDHSALVEGLRKVVARSAA
jgi:hypothetical protein